MDAGPTCPASCALGCPADSSRCFGLVPSNVPATLFDPAADNLIIEGDASLFFDTSECSASSVASHVVPLSDGSEACVLVIHDMRIDPAASLTVAGARPLIVLASGDVTIHGTLDASARMDEPGAGGFLGGVNDPAGRGPSGGEGGEHVRNFEDGGGGGGGLCGAGGNGGNGGGARGGRGGVAITATWDLQPLTGGSGGGRGRGTFAGGETNAGYGGAGGGGLQITAQGSIVVDGSILVGGGGGLPGDNRIPTGNWGSGGGGGSGGALLLEAPSVNVVSALLDAAGGGGGAIGDSGGAGGPGMDGRDTSDRAAGGAPIGTVGAGGLGGGAAVLAGDPGEGVMPSPVNGGGGGGGAGCILVRNADGALPVVGTLTPSIAPAYRAMPVVRR